MVEDALIQLYCEGDRLGAPFEGQEGPTAYDHRDVLKRAGMYPDGTDESDTVRLFIRFANGYRWAGDDQEFAVAWCDFHERHRAATSYGRTWRDHFTLVAWLRKQGCLNYQSLARVALDREGGTGSAGNGALALAYPACLFAREVGADPQRLAETLTLASHAHPKAVESMRLLVAFFCGRRSLASLQIDPGVGSGNLHRYSVLAPCTLLMAARCAELASKEEVVAQAVANGGDVDSILGLALLLWGASTGIHTAETEGRP